MHHPAWSRKSRAIQWGKFQKFTEKIYGEWNCQEKTYKEIAWATESEHHIENGEENENKEPID